MPLPAPTEISKLRMGAGPVSARAPAPGSGFGGRESLARESSSVESFAIESTGVQTPAVVSEGPETSAVVPAGAAAAPAQSSALQGSDGLRGLSLLPDRAETTATVESGVWSQNVGLVQLLGLCPLLAVSSTAVNALGLGLATLLALTATNTAISLIRRLTASEVRIPAFVMVIAAVVTSIELGMHAYLPALHAVLGIFLPLIVTNCAILARAEAKASRTDPARAALDGFAMGLGFLGVLLLLGLLREGLGQGSLFAGAGALLGLPALELNFSAHRFLIAALPPGAFVLLGLLIAARQAWLQRRERASAARTPA